MKLRGIKHGTCSTCKKVGFTWIYRDKGKDVFFCARCSYEKGLETLTTKSSFFKPGDYVVGGYKKDAAKEGWAVGFLSRIEICCFKHKSKGCKNCRTRYYISDDNGMQLNYQGFEKVKHISLSRGLYLGRNAHKIDFCDHSIWYWATHARKEFSVKGVDDAE